MTTIIWNSGTSGLWSVASNWSPAQVPGSGDTVLITQSGAYLVSLTDLATVADLTLDDAQGALSISGELDVSNALTVSAGTLEVSGTLDANKLDNAGTIQITGSVEVSNGFVNTGTVDLTSQTTDAFLTLDGTIAAASLENVSGPTGFLTVTGTVTNSVGTLDGTSLTANIISLGTVEGGTVTNLASPGSATLVGVTWQGPLMADGSLTITDGLTLTGVGGTGLGTLTQDSVAQLQIEFTNSQTFDNATVSGDGTVTVDNTLTLGSGSTFDVSLAGAFTGQTDLVFSGGTFVNHGTIFAHSTNSIAIVANDGRIDTQTANFENFGILDAADMSAPGSFENEVGFATISIADTTFDNHAGGVIEVGQSSGFAGITIAAATDLTNDGTMLTDDGATTSIHGGTIDIGAILQGSGTVDISGGGSVTLESAASSEQSLDFTGAGALVLDQPAFVPSTINGFVFGDQIELGVSATPISYASGDLKMQLGTGATIDLAITGTYSLSDFVINTGTSSTDIALACFAAGTRLATTRGMVAVETLREGDAMLLADRSGSLPVIWIGHRDLDCRHHPKPRSIWPVRIAAGAFAAGAPRRDLYLSPDHSVFVGNVLIPVKYLVNDTTIVQMPVDRVSYWHIELPRHAAWRACCRAAIAPASPMAAAWSRCIRNGFGKPEAAPRLW
jgi:collagen type I/II/III/V/XI/XXIV/XXVII alpha